MIAAPGSIIAALHGLTVTTLNPTDLPKDPARAAQSIATTGCDVAVLGPDVGIDHALNTAEEMATTFPEVEVILLAPPSEPLLGRAMQIGVRQVLAPDDDAGTLNQAVSRVASAAALRRTRLGGTVSKEAQTDEGRVITTMAAKGGVGKSTIAVNVAVELARSAPNEVVLVDLNLMAGDIDMLLGIEASATLASIACEGAVVDAAVVKLSLSTHSSGLLVLPAPATLVEADNIDPDLIVEVLTVLKNSFRFVVVDTAPGAGAALAAAAEVSDDLLAIATPDIGGLRCLRRNLDGLETLGLDRARLHLVLNRAEPRTGVTNQAIENAIELPISQSIPDCREIAVAANQGLAYVLTNPRSETARAFKTLVGRIAPAKQEGRDRQRHMSAA